MISKPTTPVIIEAVCAELETKVGPSLDATTRVVLDMATALLRATAVRSANELAWMQEEADDIEAFARRLLGERPESRELEEALGAYSCDRTNSRYLADAQADYERVSEVLSRAAEAAFASDDPRSTIGAVA